MFVPDENLLGEENKGFYLIMANFQWERLLMALGAVETSGPNDRAQRRLRRERTAFGRPIGKHQAIRHKIAEMAIERKASPRSSPTTRCVCSRPARTRSARSPRRSCCRSARPTRWPTTPSRSTAAPAT